MPTLCKHVHRHTFFSNTQCAYRSKLYLVNTIECKGCENPRDKYDLQGVGQEIAGKTCLNTRYKKLIGAKIDSYLLSQCDIETWLIYYEIQHCLPIVMEYDWRTTIEGTFLWKGLFIFGPFHMTGISHFIFLSIGKIHFKLYMPFSLLVMGSKRILACNLCNVFQEME